MTDEMVVLIMEAEWLGEEWGLSAGVCGANVETEPRIQGWQNRKCQTVSKGAVGKTGFLP